MEKKIICSLNNPFKNADHKSINYDLIFKYHPETEKEIQAISIQFDSDYRIELTSKNDIVNLIFNLQEFLTNWKEEQSKISFDQVKQFMLEWGFDVSDIDANYMAPNLLETMLDEALKIGGNLFKKFMQSNIQTWEDCSFFCAEDWESVKEMWNRK